MPEIAQELAEQLAGGLDRPRRHEMLLRRIFAVGRLARKSRGFLVPALGAGDPSGHRQSPDR
jgi:hypothetical protein